MDLLRQFLFVGLILIVLVSYADGTCPPGKKDMYKTSFQTLKISAGCFRMGWGQGFCCSRRWNGRCIRDCLTTEQPTVDPNGS